MSVDNGCLLFFCSVFTQLFLISFLLSLTFIMYMIDWRSFIRCGQTMHFCWYSKHRMWDNLAKISWDILGSFICNQWFLSPFYKTLWPQNYESLKFKPLFTKNTNLQRFLCLISIEYNVWFQSRNCINVLLCLIPIHHSIDFINNFQKTA